MRAWIPVGGVLLLVGALFGALSGCGHDPNHDINMEEARAAARRVHQPPGPAARAGMKPGHGG